MTFASYISIVVTAICATTLIDVVISDGETKKFVKSVSSILVIAALIVPLPALFGKVGEIDFERTSATEAEENLQSYLDKVNTSKIKQKEAQIQNALGYIGIMGAVVDIQTDTANEGVILVMVNLQNAVISEDIVNIDITELVKNVVSKGLNIDENLILVVE